MVILEAVENRLSLPGDDEALRKRKVAAFFAGITGVNTALLFAVIYFAGWKQHYSLYPVSAELLASLNANIAAYEMSKGAIRFPLTEPVPVKLIQRIAKRRAQEAEEGRKAQ